MWSDRPEPARLAEARTLIRQTLPPRSGDGEVRLPVARRISPPAMARILRAEDGIWLDGGDSGRHLIPLRSLAVLSCRGAASDIRTAATSVRLDLPPLAATEALLAELQTTGAGMPRLFGFVGYDVCVELEDLPAPPPADVEAPDLWMSVCDVWVEGRGDTEWVICAQRGWCDQEGLLDLQARLQTVAVPDVQPPRADAPLAISSKPAEADYRSAVLRTVERIWAGDLFEANICRRLEACWTAPPWALYERLRTISPAEYGAYLRGAGWAVMSVSPELFLRVRAGRVESRPVKGTRPRARTTATGDADGELARELLASDKDGAELAMIVDLVRNDLGRVCVPGSVRVRAHRQLMTLPTVHHTFSVVEGTLEDACAPVQLLRAAFPPGSITGAPKIQAMATAYREEPRRRGVAMGAIGWISPDGDMELSVAIRTAVAADGRVVYHAGCGIVADSDADAELEESVAKSRAFLRAIGHA